jgi:hypothetical protein
MLHINAAQHRVFTKAGTARVFGLYLNFGSFPFPGFALLSRAPQGQTAGCWAAFLTTEPSDKNINFRKE